jgi:hypothetical protein
LEAEKAAPLIKEANELASIFVASVKTLKTNNLRQDIKNQNHKSQF